MRTDSYRPQNRPPRPLLIMGGCFTLLMLVVLGGLAGIAAGVVVYPLFMDVQATETTIARQFDPTRTALAIQITQNALQVQQNEGTRQANVQQFMQNAQQATQQYNQSVQQATQYAQYATQLALQAAATQAALSNQAALINQTATQSSRYSMATRTAAAVSNARQLTQIAIDYQGTQTRLQQQATQVELDFQATQAAINGNATSFFNSNEQSNAQSNANIVAQAQRQISATPTATFTTSATASATVSITPTQTPSLTASATQIPPSATPTPTPTITLTASPTAQTSIDTDFTQGVDAMWQLSAENHWQTNTDGLLALTEDATIETRFDVRGDFVVEVRLIPALAANATYHMRILFTDDNAPLDLQLHTQALSVQTAILARATDADRWLELDRQSLSTRLSGETTWRIERIGNRFYVQINGADVTLAALETLGNQGAIAFDLPAGTTLVWVQVQP